MDFVKGDPIFTKINRVEKQYPYLTEDLDTDVIIVGGGVTGAILGYYFNQSNINAVVLEKSRIAHCSTSITTSLLQYELDSNAADLKENIESTNVIKAYELGLSAINNINEFIQTNGNGCDFKRCDSFLFGTKKSEKAELHDEYTLRKESGFDVQFVDETNTPYGFPISSGIISKNGGAVLDPYRFTHQLLYVASQKGLKIFENTEVIDIAYQENGVIVKTVFGHEVKGKIVICATGYNTKFFTKREFGTKSTTFNIATKPIDNLSNIIENAVFRDNLPVYHYFRTTPDKRLIMGGEDVQFLPDIENFDLRSRAYSLLEQRLKELFPMYNIEIEYRYCGAFESTFDDLGFVGKDKKHPNLWYCLGYGANGILFSILGAQMLVKLYRGIVDDNLYIFGMYRHGSSS